MKYECPLNYFSMLVLDMDQISEKYEVLSERNPCVALERNQCVALERNQCVALSRPAPHFQDEIVSLKKRLFLAGF